MSLILDVEMLAYLTPEELNQSIACARLGKRRLAFYNKTTGEPLVLRIGALPLIESEVPYGIRVAETPSQDATSVVRFAVDDENHALVRGCENLRKIFRKLAKLHFPTRKLSKDFADISLLKLRFYKDFAHNKFNFMKDNRFVVTFAPGHYKAYAKHGEMHMWWQDSELVCEGPPLYEP